MKTMEDYVLVRKLRHIKGLTLCEISRQTGLHRNTITKMLTEGAPPGYRRTIAPQRPVLLHIPGTPLLIRSNPHGSRNQRGLLCPPRHSRRSVFLRHGKTRDRHHHGSGNQQESRNSFGSDHDQSLVGAE